MKHIPVSKSLRGWVIHFARKIMQNGGRVIRKVGDIASVAEWARRFRRCGGMKFKTADASGYNEKFVMTGISLSSGTWSIPIEAFPCWIFSWSFGCLRFLCNEIQNTKKWFPVAALNYLQLCKGKAHYEQKMRRRKWGVLESNYSMVKSVNQGKFKNRL